MQQSGNAFTEDQNPQGRHQSAGSYQQAMDQRWLQDGHLFKLFLPGRGVYSNQVCRTPLRIPDEWYATAIHKKTRSMSRPGARFSPKKWLRLSIGDGRTWQFRQIESTRAERQRNPELNVVVSPQLLCHFCQLQTTHRGIGFGQFLPGKFFHG